MADVTNLLQSYAQQGSSLIDQKQAQVAMAGDAKRAAMLLAGYAGGAAADVGVPGRTTVDDLLNTDAEDTLLRATGRSNYVSDQTSTRTPGQALLDHAISAGAAAVRTIPDMANIAVGVVDADAGAALTRAINKGQDLANGLQSDGLNAHRRTTAARNQITSDIHAAQETEDAKSDGDLLAGLKRIGRDAISSVKNLDSMTGSDLVANAAGSMLVAGPMGRAFKAAGLADEIATPISIGLQEAGGAYNQTATQVLGMTHDQLMAGSQDYRDLIASGASPDEARNTVARNAAVQVAATQGPVAALTGKLVSKFEEAPFHVGSAGEFVGNIAKEGLEEGIQSGTGQALQNLAVQQNADQNQDLLDGVGEQIGEGALGGMGSAVSTESTGLALKDAVGALNLPATVVQAAADRYNSILARNAEASPIADDKVQAAFSAAQAATPDLHQVATQAIEESDADPEAKQAAHDYVSKLASLGQFDEGQLQDPAIPDSVRQVLQGSTDRLDSMRRLASIIDDENASPKDKLTASAMLHNSIADVTDVADEKPEVLQSLDKDHPASQMLDNYQSAIGSIRQSATVRAALDKMGGIAEAANDAGHLAPINDNQVASPEGQQAILNSLHVAEASPLHADPEMNDKILLHADQGNIQITPAQRQALEASSALVRAHRDYLAQIEGQGLHKGTDILAVSHNIVNQDSGQNGDQFPSAAEHIKRIVSAVRAGNTEQAAAHLRDFTLFAQHMQNKVGAINTHLETGDEGPAKGLTYQSLTSLGRKFIQSNTRIGVTPQSEKSVRFAQTVGNEAHTVGTLANNLVKIFPDLGVKPIEHVALAPELTKGTPAEVAKRFQEQAQASAKAEAPAEAQKEKPVQEKAPVAEKAVETSTPEPEDKGQPKGGDQSVEATSEPAAKQETPAAEPKKEEAAASARSDTVEPIVDKAAPTEPEQHDGVIARLKKFFRAPKEPKTRIFGDEAPLDTVRKVLSSQKAFEQHLGKDLNKKFSAETAKDYSEYLGYADKIKQVLARRLEDYLTKEVNSKQAGRRDTRANLFSSGDLALDKLTEARVLNLTEDRDGKPVYNPALLDSAVLAGLQWMLGFRQFLTKIDDDSLEQIMGLSSDQLGDTTSLVNDLQTGLTATVAKRSLADMIKRYWGFSNKDTAPIGQVEGIPEGMAGEVLEALLELKHLDTKQLTIGSLSNDGGEGTYKTPDIFWPVREKTDENGNKVLAPGIADPESDIHAFPDAIEQAVVMKPRPLNFIGEPSDNVPDTQLRNPEVKLKPSQKEAIKAKQATKHFVNLPMVNFLTSLGHDDVLRLFGAGNLGDRQLNKQHRATLEGQNRTFSSAYDSLVSLMAEVRNVAETTGTEIDETPIYYERALTRVNRMQMLGLDNPQASKLMREAILPTRATLDLSGEHMSTFMLALAQHLGVKVETKTAETSSQDVMDLLNGKLAKSVELLQSWLKDGGELPDETVDVLKEGLGKKLSVGAVHGLVDYARYLNADEAGRKAFTTSLYLEADGKTNGPINAMALLTQGGFTAQWLQNIRKGGLSFGAPGQTMGMIHQTVDANDLYTTVSRVLQNLMSGQVQSLSSDEGMTEKMKSLGLMMTELLGGDAVFDDRTGNFTFDRGIAKNPLTITIYGSGERGIANKMAGELTDRLYERMSDALTRGSEDPSLSIEEAMFPDLVQEDAKRKLEAFRSAMEDLTGTRFGDKIESFKLDDEGTKRLQQNVHKLFVKPLRAAIETTVGRGVMDSATTLRQAVQVQSIALQYAFKRKVEAMLAEKANDPDWHQNDFLSQKELREAWDSLADLAPLIHTKDQSWYIAGRDKADLGIAQFGRSLSGGFRSDAFVRTPSDAGVAGIPAMVIGAGDGLMMQLLAAHEDVAARTLDVFDGLNMPLDMAQDFSQKANQAVFQTWMGNPLSAVNESYKAFTAAFELGELEPNERKAYLKALGLDEGSSPSLIEAGIRQVGSDLARISLEAEARHNAMARAQLTVDQMASAAAPYEHAGEVNLEGLDDGQVVAQLNQLYEEEKAKLLQPEEAGVESEAPETVEQKSDQKSEDIAPELERVGRKLKSGARKIGFDGLKKLARSLDIPAEQRAIVGDLIRTLATKGYTIVFGSPSEVRTYADERGLSTLSEQTYASRQVNGFISPDDQTIYLHNPTSETLVHELIHAATIDKIEAYYAGHDLGPNSSEQVAAIKRIEQLLVQASGLDVSKEDAETQKAWADMLSEVEGYQFAGRHAEGLNEFMAWALSNSRLMELQKKTKVSSPLVQLARQVVDFIKKLIWGRKQMPPAADDMLSALRWNANLLLRSQQGEREAFQNTIMFHSPSYGGDDRLVELNRQINNKVIRFLGDSVKHLPEGVRQGHIARKAAAIAASSDLVLNVIDNGFPMNLQQRTTFQTLVTTLATTVELDPNALARVHDLYVHVTKTLKVEDFMKTNPEDFDQNDLHQAQQKYAVIVGNHQVDIDKQGRSSLLPAFLALAVVNDDFRDVLSRMELPKAYRNQAGTLDALLENMGNGAMDKLTNFLSGEGNAPNVQAAIDALTQRIGEIAEDRQSFLDQVLSPIGDFVDGANRIVVNAFQKGAEWTTAKADQLKAANPDSKAVQTMAGLMKGVAAVVDANTAESVAQGLVSLVNKGELHKALSELVVDMVGRTSSNANVYDMIKLVRRYIQQRRQQFREHLPTVIVGKFSRTLTDAEWGQLHAGMGKTDLASLRGRFSEEEVLHMLQAQDVLSGHIADLEANVKSLDPKNVGRLLDKAKQLARYMNTGEHGPSLLRNAFAVANLFGEGTKAREASQDLVDAIDHLTTLYALDQLPQGTKDVMSELAKQEVEGMTFTMAYLEGQRVDEMAKAQTAAARANHYKGWLPSENRPSVSLIVADDANYADLAARSFVRVGDYKGSSLERGGLSRGYYFAPVSGRAAYNQGILQNVRQTAYGVDTGTGLTNGLTAGRITNAAAVDRIWKNGGKENPTSEPLLPVWGEDGRPIAYERAVDPAQLFRLEQNTHLAKMIGQWRGRQLEELEAHHVNQTLIDHLHEMYESDVSADKSKQSEYLDLLDQRELKKDPVLADAVKLFTPETHAYISEKFGSHFYVRKDMLNDVTGYRTASIGDAWSGISRWKPEVLDQAKKTAMLVFGNKAYQYTVNAEKIIRNVMTGPRVSIVVKSIVVPVTNMISNLYQLSAHGVPVMSIARGMPRKATEVNAYLKSRLRLDVIEAELRALKDDPVKSRPLQAEAQAIADSHKRMSIWPLIEAGELSSISEGLDGHDDFALTEGRLADWIEQKVAKLPEPLKLVGRYGIVAKDTALFKGLSLAVEYGDFLAKAVLYDDMVKRKGVSQKDALAQITETFVNYDRLPGRSRGYLENMGLLWFYNFKIRSVKVAASMIRNNPVNSLISMMVPHPTMFGSIGSPITDNLFAMGIKGDLGYSIGPGMGLQSHEFNPVMNLLF